MSHIAAICHISSQYVTYRHNMSHIAVDVSNLGKICPYKKKMFYTNGAPKLKPRLQTKQLNDFLNIMFLEFNLAKMLSLLFDLIGLFLITCYLSKSPRHKEVNDSLNLYRMTSILIQEIFPFLQFFNL